MCACVSHLYVKKNVLFALQGISADGLHYMKRDVLHSLTSFWDSACLCLWVFLRFPAIICAVSD